MSAELIPAATVLLLRDTISGPEVFMVVRREYATDRFSGALVFPGGKVNSQDYDKSLRALCRDSGSLDSYQLSLRIAALRETFEESGVLLARDRDTGEMINAERMAKLASFRDLLNREELTLLALIEQENLELATDLITHFSHWVTPPLAKKRFDTHFYVVGVPADVELLHCGRETVDCVWDRPQNLLDGAESGRWNIVFPTLCNLSKVALFTSTAQLIQKAGSTPVVSVSPEVTREKDQLILRIPEDAGYPVNHQYLPDAITTN